MLLRVFKEPPPSRCYTVMEADRTGVANRLMKDSRPGRSLPRTAHHRNAVDRHKKAPATQLWRYRAFVRVRVATPGRGIDRDDQAVTPAGRVGKVRFSEAGQQRLFQHLLVAVVAGAAAIHYQKAPRVLQAQ